MRALFDVNVLVALSDDRHIHHDQAFTWWCDHQQQGWASCPLTQNGFLRVTSRPSAEPPRTLADAIAHLTGLVDLPSHDFWPDDISICDTALFDRSRLLGPKQITDAYLLALAAKNGGRLVTLDRGIPLRAVHGAEAKHLVVL